jgi:leucyl aminopeptidase (aminopeptidase T)
MMNNGMVEAVRFANKTVEQALNPSTRQGALWSKGDQIVVYADTGTNPVVWQSFQIALHNYGLEPIVVIVKRPQHDYAAVPAAALEAMKAAAGSIYVSSLGVLHGKSGQLLNRMGKRSIFAEHLTVEMMERGLKWFDPEVVEEYQQWGVKVRNAGVGAKSVRISCPHGSDFTVSVGERPHMGTPGSSGFITARGGVPSEAHLALPNEGSGDGVLVADLTMHHIGSITDPIKFTIKKGRIVRIEGGIEAEEFRRWLTDYGDANSWVLGEIAFGTNPWARSSGTMREDRKIWGTMHLGFGQNLDVGGTIDSVIHWDFAMRKPTCHVDGKLIAKDGKILL